MAVTDNRTRPWSMWSYTMSPKKLRRRHRKGRGHGKVRQAFFQDTIAASNSGQAVSLTSTEPELIEDVSPVFEGGEYARIRSGEYDAQCVFARSYHDPGFRAWKTLLRFRIIDSGQEVCGFFNLGRRPKPHVGRRSRYWAAWTLANGAPPRKRQVMTARVFRGKVFRVKVEDVTRSGDGKRHSKSAIYSTVKDVLDRVA